MTAGRAGIRAQIVDTAGNLVDDLRIERTARSIRVLNAVSPALTCSLPFADHLANLALEALWVVASTQAAVRAGAIVRAGTLIGSLPSVLWIASIGE